MTRAKERYERILKIVRLAMAGRGLTQGRLEAGIGRGKGYLTRVFGGEAQLRVIDLLNLVETLGLAEAEILGPLVLGPAAATAAEATTEGATTEAAGTEATPQGAPTEAEQATAAEEPSQAEEPTAADAVGESAAGAPGGDGTVRTE
jgi:hypothetical protein